MNPRATSSAYKLLGTRGYVLGIAICPRVVALPSGRNPAYRLIARGHGRQVHMETSHLQARSEAPSVPTEGADSFETFFARHHADLFGALYLITRDRHAAEEIMQDAFLKVLERWERVSALEDPVGYLYRTAMNLLRKRWRRAALELRQTVGFATRDDEISEMETRVDVLRALASLSPRQRAAVVLTELLEFSSEDAGRMLGIAPGTVRMHASRGRAALADILGGPP